MSIALGVDIGGSHITAGWVDLSKGVVLKETIKREAIDSKGSAESIISGWGDLLQATMQHKLHDNIKIGIAIPGPFDYSRGVSLMQEQGKFEALYGMNVRALLANQLSLPLDSFRFINDAESYLQGEMLGGACKGYAAVLGLTLGTGLGAAIHERGITRDADLWKMPFKESIAEEYLSTRWFVRQYHHLSGQQEAGLKEIIASANAATLHRLFSEFAQNFAQFLILIFNEQHFDAVVLGGNISQSHSHFYAEVNRLLGKQGIHATVLLGMLQEEAALIGAAGCWTKVHEVQDQAAEVLCP